MKKQTLIRDVIKGKPNLLFVCMLFVSMSVWAQNAPDWMDPDLRNQNYPNNDYYTGLAYESLENRNCTDVVKKVEQEAQNNALSSILLSLRSSTNSFRIGHETLAMSGVDERYVELFSTNTQIETSLRNVPQVHVDHYRRGEDVYAFAFVEKSVLSNYYDRLITILLMTIETSLDNVDSYVAIGEKDLARGLLRKILKDAADLENAQRLLLAVNGYADVRIEHSSILSKRMVEMLLGMGYATAVFLEYDTETQDKCVIDEIKGMLVQNHCCFVNHPSQADIIVRIKSGVSRMNKQGVVHTVWVDGTVEIQNELTGKTVYVGKISSIEPNHPDGVRGGHTDSYHQATRVAYKDAARIIGNKLSDIINNQTLNNHEKNS